MLISLLLGFYNDNLRLISLKLGSWTPISGSRTPISGHRTPKLYFRTSKLYFRTPKLHFRTPLTQFETSLTDFRTPFTHLPACLCEERSNLILPPAPSEGGGDWMECSWWENPIPSPVIARRCESRSKAIKRKGRREGKLIVGKPDFSYFFVIPTKEESHYFFVNCFMWFLLRRKDKLDVIC